MTEIIDIKSIFLDILRQVILNQKHVVNHALNYLKNIIIKTRFLHLKIIKLSQQSLKIQKYVYLIKLNLIELNMVYNLNIYKKTII